MGGGCGGFLKIRHDKAWVKAELGASRYVRLQRHRRHTWPCRPWVHFTGQDGPVPQLGAAGRKQREPAVGKAGPQPWRPGRGPAGPGEEGLPPGTLTQPLLLLVLKVNIPNKLKLHFDCRATI